MNPAIYRCISCRTLATGPCPEPEVWVWDQTQVPRLQCPKCGRAAVPEGWWLVALDRSGQDDPPKLDPVGMAHSRWSNCPNSLPCSQSGTYAGDCERATQVMPKCLVALHDRLAHAERALAALAGTTRGRRGARQAALPPTSSTGSAAPEETRPRGAAPKGREGGA